MRVIIGVWNFWFTRLEVIQDDPEVLHVVADEIKLASSDFLTLGERLKALLLYGIIRIRQCRRMDIVLLPAAQVFNHVDSSDDLKELGFLLPILLV